MDKVKANVVVLVLGVGLLLVSLLADVVGIGDNPGFGPQQIMGAVAGVVVIAIGAYLMKKHGAIPTEQTRLGAISAHPGGSIFSANTGSIFGANQQPQSKTAW